jgi:hypothetical protein
MRRQVALRLRNIGTTTTITTIIIAISATTITTTITIIITGGGITTTIITTTITEHLAAFAGRKLAGERPVGLPRCRSSRVGWKCA